MAMMEVSKILRWVERYLLAISEVFIPDVLNWEAYFLSNQAVHAGEWALHPEVLWKKEESSFSLFQHGLDITGSQISRDSLQSNPSYFLSDGTFYGFIRIQPPSVPSLAPWDLSIVLEALQEAPFNPLESVDVKWLTAKVLFLLVIALCMLIYSSLEAFIVQARPSVQECPSSVVAPPPAMVHPSLKMQTPHPVADVAIETSTIAPALAIVSEADVLGNTISRLQKIKAKKKQELEVYKPFVFIVFLLLYLTGLLVNSAIITVIFMDKHLHTPMYLFLCNLSLIDLCYTTVTIPKLLYMLLSGNYTVSFTQCFTQMYFIWESASTEDVILVIMAYDRYVAICKPLHYHRMFNRKLCVQLSAAIWLTGCLNSLVVTLSASKMYFCNSYIIHQYFCDAKSLMKISCKNKELLYIVICIQLLLFGFCPFLVTLKSYIKIVSAILKIKSRDGRRKAFSTCSSHLIVLTIFYGTGTSVYMMPLNDHYKVLEMVFTVLYTAVTPMLNPLIYSLQNKDVKKAMKRCIKGLKEFSLMSCFQIPQDTFTGGGLVESMPQQVRTVVVA
ncbi:olfactory receptor 1E16-like [Pseudophryne corroboree]|uniref:olfactory receptor 1E16-like n=1 Tax=Pseudophryne corroboree TaxID=495146 RepID=UPI003081F535